MNFDFIYYPLVYRAGREGGAIPGMQVLRAPAIAHRHRQHDLLALLLTVSGDHRYDPQEIQFMTHNAANAFFAVQGSVTRALQAVAESLNKQIFDRNLDLGYEGVRALAALDLVVVHNNWLFFAQVGRTRTIFITESMVSVLAESSDPGDYLGLSRRIQVRFSQAEIHSGDMLLMCEQPPASWTVQNLNGSTDLTMAQVKRRLLSQVTNSLEAVVIKVVDGRGQVRAGNWEEPVQQPEPQPSAQTPEINEFPIITDDFPAQQPDELPLEAQAEPESSSDEDLVDDGQFEPEIESQPIDEMDVERVPVIEGKTEKPSRSEDEVPGRLPLSASPGAFTIWMAKTWVRLKNWGSKVKTLNDRVTHRLKPGESSLQPGSPPLFMLVMALAIPIVIIFASLTVYTRSGKAEEHQALLVEARQAVALAEEAQDITQQRTYWAQALDLVTQAQEYDITGESQALFEKAQTTLDDLDLAGRLDFRPALTQFFPDNVIIKQIQSSSTGVYLLDQTSGSILRISLNSKGFYELDSEFQCAPGPYGLTMVTKLVDFMVLPANKDNYRVMALDEQGNLLYCRTGDLAVSRSLSAPDIGWKRIIGAAYDENILYVLDAGQSAIHIGQKSGIKHKENGIEKHREFPPCLWSPGAAKDDGNKNQIENIDQVQYIAGSAGISNGVEAAKAHRKCR